MYVCMYVWHWALLGPSGPDEWPNCRCRQRACLQITEGKPSPSYLLQGPGLGLEGFRDLVFRV